MYAEEEAVDGFVEFGVVFACEESLHVANILAGHDVEYGLLVKGGVDTAEDEEWEEDGSEQGLEAAGRDVEAGEQWLDVFGGEGCADVEKDEEEYPAGFSCEECEIEVGVEEFAGFACVGFAEEEEHGGIECGAELLEAIDIDECDDIEQQCQSGPHPAAHLGGYEGEEEAKEIVVEQELPVEILVEGDVLVGQFCCPRDDASEQIHGCEEEEIVLQGAPDEGGETGEQRWDFHTVGWLSDGYFALGCFAVGCGDFNFHSIVGQQWFDEFGPLDEAGLSAVEIVFVAHVVHFVEILDAVEIEVVDFGELGRVECILVDDGECGRGDDFAYAECLADGFDECGFAGAHAAVESEDAGSAHLADELCGGLG